MYQNLGDLAIAIAVFCNSVVLIILSKQVDQLKK